MKKNVMMRAASALLVAVLLTTCAISGTFAKYTSSQKATDSARVAYWGFNKDATIDFELFKTAYDSDASPTVKSKNTDNVIAPGTENSVSFAFSYTSNTNKNITAPEVDYKISINPTITGNGVTALDDNANFKWTLKTSGAAADEYDTSADLIAAIKALSGDASGEKEYKAGVLPADLNATYEIGWKWGFTGTETYTEAAGTTISQDEYDTAMGNAIDLADVTVTIDITATQVD